GFMSAQAIGRTGSWAKGRTSNLSSARTRRHHDEGTLDIETTPRRAGRVQAPSVRDASIRETPDGAHVATWPRPALPDLHSAKNGELLLREARVLALEIDRPHLGPPHRRALGQRGGPERPEEAGEKLPDGRGRRGSGGVALHRGCSFAPDDAGLPARLHRPNQRRAQRFSVVTTAAVASGEIPGRGCCALRDGGNAVPRRRVCALARLPSHAPSGSRSSAPDAATRGPAGRGDETDGPRRLPRPETG